MRLIVMFLMVVGLLAACASSILDGEHARTGAVLTALPDTATVELFFEGKTQPASYSDVGQVTSRAFVLEKALEELKRQARALGASGVIGVTYERKFSVDYLQDLYFAKGTAVVIK